MPFNLEQHLKRHVSKMTINVYVMVLDHGYEGKSPPVQAFTDFGEARAAMAIAKASGMGLWELYKVPVWPEPASPYGQIQPMENVP